MDEKMLKTAWWQRLVIILIAVIMLGSTVAVYISIVLGKNDTTASDTAYTEEFNKLQNELTTKQDELNAAAATLSDQYFDEFLAYRSEVRSYNANTANTSGIQTTDLKEGTGTELADGASNYMAYYIGWCADESVFDSSFDSYDSPTGLTAPIPGGNLIEGWNQGIIGMKIGGVREISMPGELAYGSTREICGGYYSPLKFVVMAIPVDEQVLTLWNEVDELSYQLQLMYYGY